MQSDIQMKDATAQNQQAEEDKKEEDKPKTLMQQLGDIFKEISEDSKNIDQKGVQFHTKKIVRFRKGFSQEQALCIFEWFHSVEAKQLKQFPIQLGEPSQIWKQMGITEEKEYLKYKDIIQIQNFVLLVVILKKLDSHKYEEVINLTQFAYTKCELQSKRSLDFQKSRILYYMALASQKLNKLQDLKHFLFRAHRISTHKLESINQATIICSILRLLFKNKQYQVASQVIAKTTFPEKAPNSQIARYNYYIGLLKAIQLEYGQAQAHLQQALRKAPQNKATAFKIAVSKILVVVELLMGEIPNRQVFSQHFQSMRAYYEIVKAVRGGQLARFRSVIDEWGALFVKDDTFSLIQRLRHNVIKFGLRNINLSYSRITLKDVMIKLNLNNENETQAICAKAIRDGVIDASLSHEKQFVQMKDIMDLYQTNEPQQAMGKRINFCIKLYQQASKALEYPYEDQIKGKQKKKPQDDKKQADKGKQNDQGDDDDDISDSDYDSDDDDLIDDDMDIDDFEF